ncbi:hypothetical protein ID866_4563 [Astraeus odoratus]|nr:hypothetical protein ID866_4563 [Astraeus odoratus]
MSSSSNYRSSHLRRVNIQPNGKRPFEECGYDSDPEPSLNNAAQASGSGNPGSSRHFTSNSSSNNGSGEGRNKRARSTSSSSTSDHSSSSDVSTSTGYDTAQSSSHSDLSSSGLSAMPRNAVDCPVVPTSAPIPQQREVSDAPIQLPRPAFAANRPTEMSASVEDTLRTSLERFNEFDRQIAALRSSLGSSSPQLASSEHAPPHEEWHAMSASFLSMNSSGLRTSDTTDESSHVPPNGAVSSFPTFGPSNPAPVGRPPVSSANSSTPFPPFGGIHRLSPYSAYRPPAAGRSSAGHENSGATLPSSSAAPSMASTSADVGMRQSSSDPVQSLPPSPQLRPVRRSPSPLSLDPLASSNSDGIGMLRNRDYGSDPQPSQAREPEHRHLSARAPAMGTFPTRPGFHSRLYSVPSSTNSLMSENAMEHRHMTARDQIWNPFPRNNSSFDVADHANDESPSSSLMNSPPRSGGSSRSEILLIPNRGESARNAEHASSNGATATGPGLATIRRPENVPEPESVIVRPPPDMIDTTFNFPMDVGPVPASPISLRDESRVESRSHSFEWMPPYTAPQRQQSQASVSTSYSYSSLNLDSFQAGMFRDTLQRSAEVRRPPPTFGRVSWGMGDDSDSSDDMDLEILRPVRQPVGNHAQVENLSYQPFVLVTIFS